MQPASQLWDYRTLEGQPDPKGITLACQEQGKEGWELCSSMVAIKDVSGGMLLKGVNVPPPQPVAILVFKRPKGWTAPEAPDGTV